MPKSLNLLQREFFQNANGRNLVLVTAGVVNSTPFDVHGATTFTVSATGVGSDVYGIEDRLTGGAWTAVPITINADGPYEFTGMYDELRVVKVSGSGTTAALTIKYGR